MTDNGPVWDGLWGWWLWVGCFFFLRRSECSGSEYIIGKLHPDKRSQSLLLNWLSLLQQYPGFTLYCSGAHIRALMRMRMEGSGLWSPLLCCPALQDSAKWPAGTSCNLQQMWDVWRIMFLILEQDEEKQDAMLKAPCTILMC